MSKHILDFAASNLYWEIADDENFSEEELVDEEYMDSLVSDRDMLPREFSAHIPIEIEDEYVGKDFDELDEDMQEYIKDCIITAIDQNEGVGNIDLVNISVDWITII